MKRLNSFTFGAGSQGRLQRPVQAEPNQRITRILCKLTFILASTDASPYNVTAADIAGFLGYIMGAITLKFGRAQQETIYQGISWATLRQIAWYMNGRDFRVSSPTATALAEKEIQAVTGTDLQIAATSSRQIVAKVWIPFVAERLASATDRFCPSAKQINDMEFYFDPGSAYTADAAKVSISGQVSVDAMIDTVSSSDAEAWANVIRPRIVVDTGLDVYAPADCGGLLGLWDQNAAGASTMLTFFSLFRRGDSPLHNNALAADVVNDASIETPVPGTNALATLATPLYSTETFLDPEDIPTGDSFYFHQNQQDIATLKLVWLYVPKVDDSYRAMVAANVAAVAEGKRAQLVGIDALAGRSRQLPGHVAAIAPVGIVFEGDPKFGALPGLVVGPDGRASAYVPPKAIQAAKANSGGTDASVSDAKELAKAIPGGRSVIRGQTTQTTADIAQRING